MNPEELKEVLSLGETRSVEFKAHCQNANIIGQVVCSFLNTEGGYVVCGVDDMGNPIGIDAPENAAINLEQALRDTISPRSLISVQVQTVEGEALLVVEVPAGKDLPYAFRDVIYIREGQRIRKADIETIRDMVLRKQVEPERWERRFSSANLEHDIDLSEIQSTVTAVRQARRTYFRNDKNPVMVLEDLSVAKYGRLTNGGDVLFGKNPALRSPQIRVRAVRFSQDEDSDTYHDMKSFEGPLVSVLEQVFDFIIRNTPTVSRFLKDKLQRQDEALYPADAIREGLVNAFAHRDYADFSGGIAVHIYPTRLEIWNSGSLPDGVTPETLSSGHLSVLRNPDIAHVLYLRGLMEKLGRGSVLILRSCKEQGLPDPKWISGENRGVTLTFFATEVTTEVTTEVMRTLNALKGEMARRELQERLGLKNDEHFRKAYLLPALEAGCIEMTIPDKPQSRMQKYRMTQKGQKVLKLRGEK